MKTLIFNGSPRKNGDTISLIRILVAHLEGEVKIVDAYYCDISSCHDCRYCWKHEGCSIKDGMQEIYKYIQECDHIIIASPIHFTELSGQLLSVMSRIQTYWCAEYFRKVIPIKKKKTGGIILVRGGNGSAKKAEDTAKALLQQMNTESIGTISSHNTNNIASGEDEVVVESVMKLAMTLNDR